MSRSPSPPHTPTPSGVVAFLSVWGVTVGILSGADYKGLKAILLGLVAAVIAYQGEGIRGSSRSERRLRLFVIAGAASAGLFVVVVGSLVSRPTRAPEPSSTAMGSGEAGETATPTAEPTPSAEPRTTPIPKALTDEIALSLPDSEVWGDLRIAPGPGAYRGDPAVDEASSLRIFVGPERCFWRHVRVGDKLTVSFRRRYEFNVTLVDYVYDQMRLDASARTAETATSLRCVRQ